MIESSIDGAVATLRLAHGKANAVDTELFAELVHRLDEIERSTARAVVLTGRGAIFSAGVDLFRVADGGRAYLEEFLPALSRGLERLFAFPRPVVAAINGHAVAGGAILACACDLRLMAEGPGSIGTPEVLVGVPFPVLPLEILRFATPPQHLQELVYGGRTLPPAEALARGLVDEVTEPGSLLDRAREAAERLAALEPEAFRLTKATLRGPVLERARAQGDTDLAVLEAWAAPRTAEVIRAYLERTVGRSH